MALSRRKKNPVVPAEIRSTTSASGARAPQRLPSLLAGKREANELASSGDSSEPDSRRPAPDAGFVPLPAKALAVTGQHAASCSRHLVSPEEGETYAAALAGSVAPLQTCGALKPTAMDSDTSESDVSSETVNRRMYSDVSGPLSDKPDGTTSKAQVTNTCLSARERPNKTLIFISGARDTRAFLTWLRANCPGGLTAQLKAEKLMVVPSTANGFRVAVSALRSIDGGEGVSFHNFTLPQDRCARLLVENLGRGMPESVVWEELESLGIHVQGVMQLRSGRRDQDPNKDGPPTPHFIVSVARGPEVSRVCSKTELCECLWSHTWLQKAQCNASAASASDTHSETADTRLGASRVGSPTCPVGAQPRGNSLSAVTVGVTTQRTTGVV